MTFAITTVLATPITATAQCGNSGERGYRTHQPVTVVATIKGSPMGIELYLVVDKAEQMLCIATKVDVVDREDPIHGNYYSTNARRISESWPVERALDSLGFGEVDTDLVRKYL